MTADAGEDETVTWEVSGDADAVTITENGNRVEVTAVKEGNATITAKSTVDSSQTAACAVRVEAADPPPAPTVTKVEVSPKTLDMTVGGNTEQLSATVTMSDGSTPPSVTWSVTAGSAVTVSGSGVVTAVSAGNATVTASAGGQSDSCAVTVTAPVANVPVTGVSIDGGQN